MEQELMTMIGEQTIQRLKFKKRQKKLFQLGQK
jgi:hypothetical protein